MNADLMHSDSEHGKRYEVEITKGTVTEQFGFEDQEEATAYYETKLGDEHDEIGLHDLEESTTLRSHVKS